jgi:hypothetical protein
MMRCGSGLASETILKGAGTGTDTGSGYRVSTNAYNKESTLKILDQNTGTGIRLRIRLR